MSTSPPTRRRQNLSGLREAGLVIALCVVLLGTSACFAAAQPTQGLDGNAPGSSIDQGPSSAVTDRSAYPSEADTGPRGPLAPYTGPLVIRENGTTIENVEIRTDQLRVAANDVQFKNVRFVYTGALDEKFALVTVDKKTTGTLFEDCEFNGRSLAPRAINGHGGITVRRCNIHHTGNAVEVTENFTVEDCYIHDIYVPAGFGLVWHADGVQARDTGVENIRVVNNTIILTGIETGAVHIISSNGLTRNVLVAGNLLAGGSYTMYAGAQRSENFVIRNNVFSTEVFPSVGRWGPWYPKGRTGEIAASGNIILQTGEAVDPPE